MSASLVFFLFALTFAAKERVPYGNPAGEPKGNSGYTLINQKSFEKGTYRITEPGYYKLTENIQFNPLAPPKGSSDAYNAYRLNATQFVSGGGDYVDSQYAIGFWAAITIETEGVTLDLNKKKIEQALGHNVMNRFFTVIELASQPFLSGQGFHNFGPEYIDHLTPDTFVAASSVTIRNGKIGRTATYGIHGTSASNIYIHDIEFDGFETSAVSLFGCSDVLVTKCTASSSDKVYLNAAWDTMINLRYYIDALALANSNYQLVVNGEAIPVTQLQTVIKDLTNTVYRHIVLDKQKYDNPLKYPEIAFGLPFFRNDRKIPDGNCYAFATHSKDNDVGGFPYGQTEFDQPSRNINFTYCTVKRLECQSLERVALTSYIVVSDAEGFIPYAVPILDARGHVFSLLNNDWDYSRSVEPGNSSFLTVKPGSSAYTGPLDYGLFNYKGNPVSNAQAIVGKAILDGNILPSTTRLNTRRQTFNRDVLKWVEATNTDEFNLLETYITSGNQNGDRTFICNGDETYRTQTGVVGFRISSTWGGRLYKNKVKSAVNWGARGDQYSCPGFENYTRSHYGAVLTGYTGADSRGYAFAGCQDLMIDYNMAMNVKAATGRVVGFDVLTDSQNLHLNRNEVRHAGAGLAYKAAEAPQYFWNATLGLVATPTPIAVGFHVDQRALGIVMDPYCVNDLYTYKDKKGPAFKTAMPNSTLNSKQFDPLATPAQMVPKEWKGCHSTTQNIAWWLWLIVAIVCLIFIIALVAVLLALMDGGSGANDSYQEMK